ncbi:MAG TPA: ATP-binding cassette domain-containing protein [bacterium]|nr:ATP-binding cassette domain-containing protein [bacterium]
MRATIQIENVTKRFKDTVALDHVTFSLNGGEIFGLLGPNGAGKTTLMRILVGILGPDEGQIRIASGERKRLKERIGYLPEERGLYPKMKVGEFLQYCARMKGVPKPSLPEMIRRGLERVGLAGQEEKKIGELSKGNQQRVQLLITLIHQPDILILDEPFAGLDPIGADKMRDILTEEAQRGATVIISTHRMEDAERLCRSIALIHRGKLIRWGVLDEIKKSEGRNQLIVEYSGDAEMAGTAPGILSVKKDGSILYLEIEDDSFIPGILRDLSAKTDLYGVRKAEQTLHDIFVHLVENEENKR